MLLLILSFGGACPPPYDACRLTMMVSLVSQPGWGRGLVGLDGSVCRSRDQGSHVETVSPARLSLHTWLPSTAPDVLLVLYFKKRDEGPVWL